MNAPAQVLECGVYPDMPESEYFALKAVSNSRLQPLLRSPAHCLYSMQHPQEPTAAMQLGSAVDCLVFSPTFFNERFAVAEQCSGTTKEKKRCSKNGTARFSPAHGPSLGPRWYCGIHSDNVERMAVQDGLATYAYERDHLQTLSPDQSSTAFNMAKAVLNHDGAKVLLDSCEHTQLSLVWRENNLICKGRLDGLSSELNTVIDLKTCADASPEAFSRKVADFGYHRQAAMYLRGCEFHGIDAQNYVIIAVENEPPHAVALYTLTERQPLAPFGSWRDTKSVSLSPVEYGNHELLRLLDLYERCEATGIWEGYPAQPVPISLPGWVMARMERE